MKTRRIGAGRTGNRGIRGFLAGPGATAGNVSIEMALVLTFLLTLILGAFDFGRLVLSHASVTNAARAGAQWAVLEQVYANDSAGMIQAARDEVDDVNNQLNITATSFCRCPSSTGTDSCTADCPDGEYAPLYVQVTVQDQVDMLFAYPGVSDIQALSSTTTMRIR